MKRMLTKRGLCWAILMGLGVVLSQVAVGDDKAGGKKGQTGEAKPHTGTLATTIDWGKTLGLNFPSLTTLGARIEQARSQADPVGLAAAAKELAAAETVSGKNAAITAADLLKEATELAKFRFDANELKAVALLIGDGADSLDLLGEAKKAAKFHAEQRKARQAGETTRGIRGQVRFDSRVDAFISCYVNGRYVGSMGPVGDVFCFVGDPGYLSTHLYARSNDGRFWRMTAHGDYDSFHWTLYP